MRSELLEELLPSPSPADTASTLDATGGKRRHANTRRSPRRLELDKRKREQMRKGAPPWCRARRRLKCTVAGYVATAARTAFNRRIRTRSSRELTKGAFQLACGPQLHPPATLLVHRGPARPATASSSSAGGQDEGGALRCSHGPSAPIVGGGCEAKSADL